MDHGGRGRSNQAEDTGWSGNDQTEGHGEEIAEHLQPHKEMAGDDVFASKLLLLLPLLLLLILFIYVIDTFSNTHATICIKTIQYKMCRTSFQ